MKKLIGIFLAVFMLLPFSSCVSEGAEQTEEVYTATNEVHTTTNADSQGFLAYLQERRNNETDSDSETVYVTASGERYHKQNCRHVKRSKTVTAISVSEAKKDGYTPCKTCYR